MNKKILLIDANAPWVRSLFAAMKGTAEVYALTVRTVMTGKRPALGELLKWRQHPDGMWEKSVLIPGMKRHRKISSWIVRRAVMKKMRQLGGADLVVYTLPMYCDIAAGLSGRIRQVYYAYDPFRFYDWDVALTMESERKILAACDVTLAVATALVDDLRKVSAKPVIHSPNAVSKSFVEKLAGDLSVPADLADIKHPIVGCTGQIGSGYDWSLVGAMADAMPNATFIFVGPMLEEPPAKRELMEKVLGKANVKWIGPRPHDQLPAYLKAFDVCLNPLSLTEHNHRRSPLRLYDYLATDKPILSTAVQEALTHGPLIETFANSHQGIDLLWRMLSGNYRVDRDARRAYIRENTWEVRATQFLSRVEEAKG